MANVLIDETVMTDIANAIRTKTEKTELMYPRDMPQSILEIKSGGSQVTLRSHVCGGASVMITSPTVTCSVTVRTT